MKHQFLPIFRHEFKTTVKSKPFIITTVLFALIFIGAIGFPAFLGTADKPRGSGASVDDMIMSMVGVDFGEKKLLVSTADAEGADAQSIADYMKADELFGFGQAEVFGGTAQEMKASVDAEEADYALWFSSPLAFTLYVRELGMTDMSPQFIAEAVTAQYRASAMERLGATAEQAEAILSAMAQPTVVATKNDGVSSQVYTYLLLYLLMLTIMIYGGTVASSVAAEKSSRAMELLITAARPGSLMAGKVLGVGLAGMLQLVSWVLCACAGYVLSGKYWSETPMLSSLFEGGNVRLLVYTVVFFVLGYLVFSFLFGAVGSLVSRTEDLQATMTPLSLVVVAVFFVCYFSTILGYWDSVLIKVLSYVPFTAPLAMFIRIVNNNAANWEIALSIVSLIAGIFLVGVLATAIYRVGVLLYGKPPKIRELFKLIRKQ